MKPYCTCLPVVAEKLLCCWALKAARTKGADILTLDLMIAVAEGEQRMLERMNNCWRGWLVDSCELVWSVKLEGDARVG